MGKAEVFIEGVCCGAKVRIYRHQLGHHLIEMQRRRGCSNAFWNLYSLTTLYLNSCTKSVQVIKAAEFEVVAPPLAHDVDSERSLEPLLDLAETGNPELQAEAVQGLLQAAKDVNLAVQMCTPQVFM